MKSVTSISGGKTSAYLATHYPTDYNVFSLVRIEDEKCKFPDPKIRQMVEDKIQKPFIATAEMDEIIYTILDLEQHIGREITWVSGVTFDEVIEKKGGWLPNKMHRYCTTEMKMIPIFEWWYYNIGEPVEMNIGYRANEKNRVRRMLDKLNDNGLNEIKHTLTKHPDGRNKWEVFEWRKPAFPLYDDRIFKDKIEKYWSKQDVRFAIRNNCVGCFNRNPLLLNKMAQIEKHKMEWFASKEEKGYWRSDGNYRQFIDHNTQTELSFDDFNECDSGFCGL